MLPIRDEVLPLHVVAEFWSRELAGVRTAAEIHSDLLSAFWHDELTVFGSSGDNRLDRRQALGWVGMQREHPGFTVVDHADMIPGSRHEGADGGIIVDLTEYVVIPSDVSHWTDDVLAAAYRTLSTMSVDDFHDLLKPGFWALHITKSALSFYCDLMDYKHPRFWFGIKRVRRWTKRDELRATESLKQIGSGRKCKPKAAYFNDLVTQFPGMPWKAFLRVWDKAVPEEWKRSGPVVRSGRSKLRP